MHWWALFARCPPTRIPLYVQLWDVVGQCAQWSTHQRTLQMLEGRRKYVDIESEGSGWVPRLFRCSPNARPPGKRMTWYPRGGWVRWVALVGCAQGETTSIPHAK